MKPSRVASLVPRKVRKLLRSQFDGATPGDGIDSLVRAERLEVDDAGAGDR
jgi:hypothetical protein